MVALSVAAILLGVGIPSFSQAVKNSRISGNYNSVAQALYIARSEAVKSSELITVCPRAPGTGDDCGTDWSEGILVFTDLDPVSANPVGSLGAEDIILYSQTELRKGSTLTAWASSDRTQASEAPSYVLRYQPNGNPSWANGYFSLCDDDRGVEFSRTLNIVLTGDIRRGRPVASGSHVPANVFGNPLDKC